MHVGFPDGMESQPPNTVDAFIQAFPSIKRSFDATFFCSNPAITCGYLGCTRSSRFSRALSSRLDSLMKLSSASGRAAWV